MSNSTASPMQRRAEKLVRCRVILLTVESPMGRVAIRHPVAHLYVQQGRVTSWSLVRDDGDSMLVKITGTSEQIKAYTDVVPE